MDEDTSEILDGDVRFILETFVRERRMSFIAFKQVWKRINGPLLHRLLGNDSFDVRQDNYQRLYAHFLTHIREPNFFIRIGVIYCLYVIAWTAPYVIKTPIKLCPETWQQILSMVRICDQYEAARKKSPVNEQDEELPKRERCDIGDIVRFMYRKKLFSFGLYIGPQGFAHIALRAQKRISFARKPVFDDMLTDQSTSATGKTCSFTLYDTCEDLPAKSKTISGSNEKLRNDARLSRNYRRNASFLYARASGRFKGQNFIEDSINDSLSPLLDISQEYQAKLQKLARGSKTVDCLNASKCNSSLSEAAELLQPKKKRKTVEGGHRAECVNIASESPPYLPTFYRPKVELQLMRARWYESRKRAKQNGGDWLRDEVPERAGEAQHLRPTKHPQPRDTYAPAYLFETGVAGQTATRKFAVGCVEMGLNLPSVTLSSHSKMCQLLRETDIAVDREANPGSILEEYEYPEENHEDLIANTNDTKREYPAIEDRSAS